MPCVNLSIATDFNFEAMYSKAKEAVTAGVETLDSACLRHLEMNLEGIANSIHHVAMQTFIILLTTLFFLANASVFVIGAIISIADKDSMDSMIARLLFVWERQDFTRRAVITTAALFAWPIAFAASAFFVGANIGSWLQEDPQAPAPGSPSQFDHPR